MNWLTKLFGGRGQNEEGDTLRSALSPANQKFLNETLARDGKIITRLSACHTRQQVIDVLRAISNESNEIAPIAARAANELDANLTLDAFRIRDDMVRTLEAFHGSWQTKR